MRSFHPIVISALAAVLLTLVLSAPQQAQEKPTDKLAPYYPTPEVIVDKMLQLGGLKAGEKMFDLGSGDGRLVIAAARKYKADATGVELDDSLFKQSMEKIRSLGLSSTARIIHGDLLQQDRIVAHDFEFSAWKAEKIQDIDDDGEGRAHRLYLYRR
jgi:tRNA G46 methylase TrmB